ncbi:GNAT family N-acetyltransferase [Rhizobium lusitanum]|uniref:GNAT family N-acetyltransferase n=2 Tax=Rhizobium lusitanum TaxID=293958 RepID=A0A6L9UB36_9HYPH|nr:GNAT family N-acetyltransferase [Rhizobium lusitanum]
MALIERNQMIVETTSEDYTSLICGCAPRTFTLADTPIAPAPVLEMLAEVAAKIRQTFTPASWLIVHDNEVVGMCSVTRSPENGVIDIGYGIAASQAIADIVEWASNTPGINTVTAETSLDNRASQRVLQRNGFAMIGERYDEEDGQLIRWCRFTK